MEERYPILLGFNEPNHEDQSNIEPEMAAAAWIELQNLYPDKVSNSSLLPFSNYSLRSWSVRPRQVEVPAGLIHSLRWRFLF